MTLSSRHYICLALFAFLLALPGRISLPPLDRDEPRYMQATAQMLESGNYLDIRYQDQPRYLQPAGIYWLEAGAVKLAEITTHNTNLRHTSWPFRLPSLLASTLSVLLTAWLGARLFNGRVGLLAACLLMVAPLFAAESRMATIDSVLLLDILALQALLLRHFNDMRASKPTPIGTTALYWGLLGIGLMLKGPIILIPALGTIFALCFCRRSLALWRQLRPLWGSLLSLLIVLPWCLGITLVSHGDFFRRAVGHNLLGKVTHAQETHGFPPGYYTLLFLLAFWPGALYAARALPHIWQRRTSPNVQFLLCWIIPHWCVFEALATKLPHYVLPTYPAIAILTAAGLYEPINTPLRHLVARILLRSYALLWGIAGILFCGAGLIALYKLEGHIYAGALIPACGSLPLLVAALWYMWRQRWRDSAYCTIGTALILEVGIFLIIIPHLTAIQLSPRIAESFYAMRPCQNSVLISPSYKEPSLVFLTGGTTRLLPPAVAAQNLRDNARCDLVLVDQKDEGIFNATLKTLGTGRVLYDQFEGLNYSNGHKMTLRLYAATSPTMP